MLSANIIGFLMHIKGGDNNGVDDWLSILDGSKSDAFDEWNLTVIFHLICTDGQNLIFKCLFYRII